MASNHIPKPESANFESGSAVEVSIDDDGFSGSWFSGTIVRCIASDRFLVEYQNLITDEQSREPLREVLSLHQLRPLPPPESHWEFKSGDKVDAFHNDGWWEGHITKDFENGRFGVYFKVSEENIVFPKEQLRAHREWINDNWVPPITKHKVLVRGKESEGKLEVETKIQRQSRSNGKDERDRISKLPDSVLLHIMSFLSTKYAVRTCVLSKRWKDLCKCLTSLTFHSQYRCDICFRKFVSWVLASRNHSYSLLNLVITEPKEVKVLDMLLKYAVSHDVQHLTLQTYLTRTPTLDSLPLIFCSKSLTSLDLRTQPGMPLIVLPKSMHLPALKSLHLENVDLPATDNDLVEPFSNCPVLDTLHLENFSLHKDAPVLCISNTTLSSLKIYSYYINSKSKIALSTPNLVSFTIQGTTGHQLFSTCNLSLVGPVSIGMYMVTSSIILGWLQGLANVKILTMASTTLGIILDNLLYGSVRLQPPCFARLESLKVTNRLVVLSDGQIKRAVEYLLENSPMATVDIIKV